MSSFFKWKLSFFVFFFLCQKSHLYRDFKSFLILAKYIFRRPKSTPFTLGYCFEIRVYQKILTFKTIKVWSNKNITEELRLISNPNQWLTIALNNWRKSSYQSDCHWFAHSSLDCTCRCRATFINPFKHDVSNKVWN